MKNGEKKRKKWKGWIPKKDYVAVMRRHDGLDREFRERLSR